MPLLDDELSIWEIAFRWAGLNPQAWRYRFYIPIEVKDNIRCVTQAILQSALYCHSLKVDVLFEHATRIDQDNLTNLINSVFGSKYDRNFLSHKIDRRDFAKWCAFQAIPLPDFWYPEIRKINDDASQPYSKKVLNRGKRDRNNEMIWLHAVIAARTLWAKDNALSIAEVVRQIQAMPELKASAFTADAIRKHIAPLSPIPGKPGRKPKNN